MQLSILGLIVAGIFISGRRAQTWIAGSLLFPLVIGQLLFRLLPGLA